MSDSNDEIEEVRALTKEEAALVKAANPSINPWKVVVWQLVVTLGIVFFGFATMQQQQVIFSLLWGGLCVVIPASLLARGMTRSSGANSLNWGSMNFIIWESLKVAISIAMLWIAPKIVSDLSWLALVASFIVVTKVYWLASFCLIKQRVNR